MLFLPAQAAKLGRERPPPSLGVSDGCQRAHATAAGPSHTFLPLDPCICHPHPVRCCQGRMLPSQTPGSLAFSICAHSGLLLPALSVSVH